MVLQANRSLKSIFLKGMFGFTDGHNQVVKRLQNLINIWVPKNVPFRNWILICTALLVLLSNRTGLNTNVMSRVALMMALTEKQSFEISPWHSLTLDWARTPDGSYYSNKAPGPSLLAAPVFAVLYEPIYSILKRVFPEPKSFNIAWNNALSFIMWILSIIFQIVPFVFFVSRLAIFLERNSVPKEAICFFVCAALFGNTGCFYLNCFHGHGYAMACALGVLFYLLKAEWVYVGLFLGGGFLGDYSSFLLVPLIFVWILVQEPPRFWRQILIGLAKGAIIPTLVFAFYHLKCFGGILTLPQKFQNPIFVYDVASYQNFGVISFLPKPEALIQLLFGPVRGVLITQPYVLILSCVFIMLFVLKLLKTLTPGKEVTIGFITALFFLELLWMNAGFNGWHGGSAPGPRYLVAVFPMMAFSGALAWKSIPNFVKNILWVTLAFSVMLFCVVLVAGATPTEYENLFSFYYEFVKSVKEMPKYFLRAMLVIGGFFLGLASQFNFTKSRLGKL